MSDWGGWRAIVDEARELQKDEQAKKPVACPRCGELLQYNERLRQYGCPLGHYRTN